MKRVKYLKPRVSERGAIPVGTNDTLHDGEAAKLAARGEVEIVADVHEPAKPKLETPADEQPAKADKKAFAKTEKS